MKARKMNYKFDLKDYSDLKRIEELFEHLLAIQTTQNSDSKNSIGGGASVHYVIKIEVEEKWI